MILHNEWMSDNEYFGENYSNNVLLADGIRRFEIQLESLEGKDALIDGDEERIIAQNHTNPLNQSKYDKKLSCSLTSKIHTGSLVEFDSKKWLVVSKVFNKDAYLVASVLECTNTLKFYNKNHISCEIPFIYDHANMGVAENKYITSSDTKIKIIIPKNENTLQIKRNDIFDLDVFNNEVFDSYQVLDFIRLSEGLIILEMKKSAEQQDVESEIDYTVQIIGSKNIIKGTSETFSCIFKNNGIEITEESVFYLTSDDGVSTIDVATIINQDSVNNSCTIQSNNTGHVKLWVKNIKETIISDAFRIEIDSLF